MLADLWYRKRKFPISFAYLLGIITHISPPRGLHTPIMTSKQPSVLPGNHPAHSQEVTGNEKSILQDQEIFLPASRFTNVGPIITLRCTWYSDTRSLDRSGLRVGVHQFARILRHQLPHNAARIYYLPDLAPCPHRLRRLPYRQRLHRHARHTQSRRSQTRHCHFVQDLRIPHPRRRTAGRRARPASCAISRRNSPTTVCARSSASRTTPRTRPSRFT